MAITDNLTDELRAEYEAGPAGKMLRFMGYTEEELRAIVQHYQTMTGLADRDQDLAVLREQQEKEFRAALRDQGTTGQPANPKAQSQADWEARERENKETYALEEEKAQAEYEVRDYATAIGRIEGALAGHDPREDAVAQFTAQAVLDLLRRQMFLAERRRDKAENQIRERLARRDEDKRLG